MSQPASLAAVPGPVAAPLISPAPVVSVAPPVVTSAAVPATAPAPALPSSPAPAAGAAPPPAPPPPLAGTAQVAYPYLVGPPGSGVGSAMTARAATKEPAAERDTAIAEAAAASGARAHRRPRRRTGLIDRGYRYEYLDLSADAEPDTGTGGEQQAAAVLASGPGAGTQGFAGTAHREHVGQPAGLVRLGADPSDDNATMPMMPGSWGTDPPPEEPPRTADDG
jgi:PPE-repeat protein